VLNIKDEVKRMKKMYGSNQDMKEFEQLARNRPCGTGTMG
jgi:hypothetical protein